MPDSVPVRLDVVVSVAVIDCVPAVSSVTEKVCVPVIGGGERVAGRQDGLRVAAGQGHRAGVTGRHVAVGVVGGDRDAYSAVPAVSLVGKPVTVSDLAAAACTVMPDSVPVMLDVARVGRRDRLRAGRLERDR